jgi:hypothetical protein
VQTVEFKLKGGDDYYTLYKSALTLKWERALHRPRQMKRDKLLDGTVHINKAI